MKGDSKPLPRQLHNKNAVISAKGRIVVIRRLKLSNFFILFIVGYIYYNDYLLFNHAKITMITVLEIAGRSVLLER